MKRTASLFLTIFLASFASLSYEIALTRVFSITLWYHFAFMVISIAMLGLGASGTLLSVFPRFRDEHLLDRYLMAFCISIPASFLLARAVPFDPAKLSWDSAQVVYISFYYILLSLPFFFFGLIVATAFTARSDRARYIYGADLTGAGAGSLATLWLLSLGGPGNVVFFVSSLALFPLLFRKSRKAKVIAFALIALNISILSFQPHFAEPKISPFKALMTALRFPGSELVRTYHSPFSRVDIFRSPAARFAPGLSFRYLDELPEQTGIAVDAASLFAVTDGRDRARLRFLEYLPSSLPYMLAAPPERVLALDPKGGLSILSAEFFGAREIFRVESDPLLLKAVREYEGFSSEIYDRNTWSGLGRSWLAASRERFDLIDISYAGSMPSGAFGFSEDYRFTVEAFAEYLSHLTPEGILSITLFIIPPPRTELRIINTIAEASGLIGIDDPGNHVAAIRSWGTVTILFKRSEFSAGELNALRDFSGEKRFDVIYYPGVSADETNVFVRMPSNEYYEAFRDLLSSKEDRKRFAGDYLFDISPVHDDNPFFNYYLKVGNVREIYALMGNKWQYFLEEGYLLPVIFLQVLLICIVLISIPLAAGRSRLQLRGNVSAVVPLSYFAFLGIAFMFVELSFIQKMILPLENPAFAAAAVLSSTLISSGIGSFMSEHFRFLQKSRIVLLLSLILLCYALFLPWMTENIHHYPLPVKLLLVFFLLMPAGMLMGIPFPMGLSLLGRANRDLIPWAWAVNGCLSVTSPIAALMLAIHTGFSIVMGVGVLMYLLAFLTLSYLDKYYGHLRRDLPQE